MCLTVLFYAELLPSKHIEINGLRRVKLCLGWYCASLTMNPKGFKSVFGGVWIMLNEFV